MLVRILKKLPYEITQPIKYIRDLIPDYYRYGEEFRTIYYMLKQNEFLHEQMHVNYQLSQLQKILYYSYENIPYYRKVFDERNLRPKDFVSIEDLTKLPYLTKEIIQNNYNDLINNNYKKSKLIYQTTGGSSGNPLGFYEDKEHTGSREWAYVTHLWSRVGYNIKRSNKFVILRGNKVKKNIIERQGRHLVLSSYHLNEQNIIKYVCAIQKFDPDFIQAYPSSIETIASYILNEKINIKIKSLQAILCSSENLFPYQREMIEEAFRVKIFNLYGHTEHSTIAGDCGISKHIHFQSEYGIVELINNEGELTRKEHERGEIVATSFNNYVMPFIRYRTGDIAIHTTQKCECGRAHRLTLGIEGRENDQIISKSGAKISLTSIIFAQHFDAFTKIHKMQLEQKEIGKIFVKVMEQSKLTESEKGEIVTKIKSATHNELDIDVVIVDDIPLTERGKHKMLLQHLKI